VYELRAQMNAGKVGESEKAPMLQRLLQYRYSLSNELMPERDIISECMGHLIAGSDTTSTSLSYFFWELSCRADVVKNLQASRSEPSRTRVPPSTSKNGISDEMFDLMGYAVPPGTIVSTQAWSMHRDASVFPSPDTFLPERRIETSTNVAELFRMSQHMMPFGTGTRVCGGQNFALAMMRVVIAAVVRNLDVVAPPETNERSMEVKDSFVIFPAVMERKLGFIPRQK
jgi:cytochrome P450